MIRTPILPGSILPISWTPNINTIDMSKSTPGQIAARQDIFSVKNEADITIETADGDRVIFNYQSVASQCDYFRRADVTEQGHSESQFDNNSMSVVGELDAQERADIEAFEENMSAIMDAFFAGKSSMTGDQIDLDLSNYQALNSYSMSLNSQSITSSWVTGILEDIDMPLRESLQFNPQETVDDPGVGNEYAANNGQELAEQVDPYAFNFAFGHVHQHTFNIASQRIYLPIENIIANQQEAYAKQEGLNALDSPAVVASSSQEVDVTDRLAEMRQDIIYAFTRHGALAKDDSSQKFDTFEQEVLDLIDRRFEESKEA